jgi:glycosyltransferase involved in cell wall biosynthesis
MHSKPCATTKKLVFDKGIRSEVHHMNISIVIPTKNRSSDVEMMLDSLPEQTLKPNEVIFVDDSFDLGTKRLVRKYRSAYLRMDIALRHIWDLGSTARARTLGGQKSEGEIIIYVDDDLTLKNDSIEMLVKTLLRTKAMAVWGNINFGDSRNSGLVNALAIPYYHFLFGSIKNGGGLFVVRRKVIEDKVWFDQNLSGYALCEDKDFALNLCRHYGLDSIKRIERPILAINRGKLVKDKIFYLNLFGTTLYYSKKWGGTARLIIAFLVNSLLCGFHMISEGGRSNSVVTKREILGAYLNVSKNLRLTIRGKFDS